MQEKTVHIPKISCGHCVAAIKREAGEIEGVASVEGDIATKNITFRFGPPATWEEISAVLAELGYPAEPFA